MCACGDGHTLNRTNKEKPRVAGIWMNGMSVDNGASTELTHPEAIKQSQVHKQQTPEHGSEKI